MKRLFEPDQEAKISTIVTGSPLITVEMNKDLYCLGYTMCMSNEELVKIIEEDNETEKMKQIQSVPKDVNLNKLFVMVVFCFMC